MEREALLKLLGLDPDATDDEITNKVSSLTEQSEEDVDLDDLEIQVGDPDEDGKSVITVKRGEATKDFEVKAPSVKEEESEEEDELAALAEKHPEVAQLVDRVGHLETAQRLSEIQTTLSEVGSEHKKALSPAAQKKLQGLMLRLNEQATEDFVSVLNDIADPKGSGFVDLSEKGRVRTEGEEEEEDESDEPAVKFMDKVFAAREEDEKLTLSEAIRKVADEDEALYLEYREATTH